MLFSDYFPKIKRDHCSYSLSINKNTIMVVRLDEYYPYYSSQHQASWSTITKAMIYVCRRERVCLPLLPVASL